MNVWDIIIIAAIAGLVLTAILLIRRRRNTGCSCGCGSCRKSCKKRQS